MDKSQVRVGQRVNYKARTAAGTGKIIEVTTDANASSWVIVRDTGNKVEFKLRPSQLTKA